MYKTLVGIGILYLLHLWVAIIIGLNLVIKNLQRKKEETHVNETNWTMWVVRSNKACCCSAVKWPVCSYATLAGKWSYSKWMHPCHHTPSLSTASGYLKVVWLALLQAVNTKCCIKQPDFVGLYSKGKLSECHEYDSPGFYPITQKYHGLEQYL